MRGGGGCVIRWWSTCDTLSNSSSISIWWRLESHLCRQFRWSECFSRCDLIVSALSCSTFMRAREMMEMNLKRFSFFCWYFLRVYSWFDWVYFLFFSASRLRFKVKKSFRKCRKDLNLKRNKMKREKKKTIGNNNVWAVSGETCILHIGTSFHFVLIYVFFMIMSVCGLTTSRRRLRGFGFCSCSSTIFALNAWCDVE